MANKYATDLPSFMTCFAILTDLAFAYPVMFSMLYLFLRRLNGPICFQSSVHGCGSFSLLNGAPLMSCTKTSPDHFSARYMECTGLYHDLDPFEFQLFDYNSRLIRVSAEALVESSPYRIGSSPRALARRSSASAIPSNQICFIAESLDMPHLAVSRHVPASLRSS